MEILETSVKEQVRGISRAERQIHEKIEHVASKREVYLLIHITCFTVAKHSSLLLKMGSVCTDFIHHPIHPLSAT